MHVLYAVMCAIMIAHRCAQQHSVLKRRQFLCTPSHPKESLVKRGQFIATADVISVQARAFMITAEAAEHALLQHMYVVTVQELLQQYFVTVHQGPCTRFSHCYLWIISLV